MPANGYSGGRLLALTMAESLAMVGVKVDFITNAMPEMYEDYRSFSKIKLITADLTNLSSLVENDIDIVIIIPSLGLITELSEWVRHAIECRAKVVLLNFETPNWFNKLSPFKKDPRLWKGWDIVGEFADLILSISEQGNYHAKKYFIDRSKYCLFDWSYPAINSVLADQVSDSDKRVKRIILLTRFDRHKGFDLLGPLLNKNLAGYEVELYLGIGTIKKRLIKVWRKRFQGAGLFFSVKPAIGGINKFKVLKSSSLLYFPTLFEGFGIPPLEAAYCGLPCACSKLPVLMEFGKDSFFYADPHSRSDMHKAVIKALSMKEYKNQDKNRFKKIAKMEEYGKRLVTAFNRIS